MILVSRFIPEILDGSRETAVLDHVGIAQHFQFERERNSFGECALLKDATANELSANLGEDRIAARFEEVDLGNLSLLMQLLRLELRFFCREFRARFFVRLLEEHLFKQIWMIEIFRVAF